jgi:SSS family transporter
MRTLDWAVLAASLIFIVSYGLYKSRGSNTVNKYLLAGKTMPWYAMALSIMATQASAITFISTTGQAYVDGMRFVQFYFGLPVAMVILCATAVPSFHRANVYTAYEYLERRFDAKTRTATTIIFLIQRGLAVGLALYAPAIVLAVVFGWPDQITTVVMGGIVIFYTVIGGIQAVTWTDVQQMLIIFLGLFVAVGMALYLLPADISALDAMRIAGAAGKLNAVDFRFNPNQTFTLWSGLIGGAFLALAYFGTDQSQVQRYLTGKSIAQSRLSLLFNAMAKLPMQFFILLTGALVFVFYLFVKPPVLFEQPALDRIQARPEFAAIQSSYDQAFETRRIAARAMLEGGFDPAEVERFRGAEKQFLAVRRQAGELAVPGFNDTNYIFLTFVTRHLPVGVVGLILAAIFAAAMSTISAEVNALATVTVIDIYQRHIRPRASDRQYLNAARLATLFWGGYAVMFAEYGRNLGSLIVAVNMLGSLFYGSLLGVFAVAFFMPRAGGNAAFFGLLAGEAAILATWKFTGVSFLWYNVVGCLVVLATAWLISRMSPRS